MPVQTTKARAKKTFKPIISVETDAVVEWTTADASALHAFLITDSGQRLCARLRFAVQVINASAVQTADAHRAGDAAGYMRCVSDLQTLSAPVPPQEDQSDDEMPNERRPAIEHLIS